MSPFEKANEPTSEIIVTKKKKVIIDTDPGIGESFRIPF